MKNYIIFVSLVILTSFSSFLINDAYASTDIDLQDQQSCQATPLFGAWNATSFTCTISKLRLDSGYSLTIDNSVFPNIVLATTGYINNGGTIDNYGIINIDQGSTIDNYGKIINNQKGSIINSGTLVINEFGVIINNGGTINNYATMTQTMRSVITNSGMIKNMCGGSFSSNGNFNGNPVENSTCIPKPSIIPEFPIALLTLVIGMISMIIFYRIKR
jgi:hypothetical protein